MANKESIQRSDILTDRALPFLTFKKEFIEKKTISSLIKRVIISKYQIMTGIIGNGNYNIKLKQQKN